jgi:hypothetical protein
VGCDVSRRIPFSSIVIDENDDFILIRIDDGDLIVHDEVATRTQAAIALDNS